MTDLYGDNPNHPFVRGDAYHDPTNRRRVGPRGGLHRMSHDREEDRESLMTCNQIVVRGPQRTLALCDRPRYQHRDEREEIV